MQGSERGGRRGEQGRGRGRGASRGAHGGHHQQVEVQQVREGEQRGSHHQGGHQGGQQRGQRTGQQGGQQRVQQGQRREQRTENRGGRGGQQGQRGEREGQGYQRTTEVARRREGVAKALPTIRLITNMFRADKDAVEKVSNMIQQYEVVVSDIIILDETGKPKPRKKSSRAISLDKDKMREIIMDMGRILKILVVSNGKSTIYSIGSLEDSIHNQLPLDKALENMTLKEKTIDSSILSVQKGNEIFFLQIKKQEWNKEEQMTQMLQVAVSFSFFVKAKMLNKKFYISPGNMFMDDATQLFDQRYSDLMLLRGIFQSFRVNANQMPMVNIDVSYFPAVRDNISFYDVLCMHAQYRKLSLAQALHNPKALKDMNEKFKGARALTTYDTCIYTLDHIAMDKGKPKTASTAMFQLRDKKNSRMISVYEYYTSVKGIKLQHPDQPVIVPKGKKEDIMIPTELLRLKFGESRALFDEEPSQMITMTRHMPAERFGLIEENAQKIRDLEYWKQFGINIYEKFQVDGKLLPTYQLTYSNETAAPRDGTWNLDGKKLFEVPEGLQNWAVVYPRSRYNHTGTMVKNLVAMARVSGYDIAQEPVWVELATDTPDCYEYELKQAVPKNRTLGVSFYLIILPDKTSERYRKIKGISHTELGIVTQCVVLGAREDQAKISKMTNKSVLANIIAGINPKLRNQNCIITPDQLRNCLGGKNLDGTILMGLDVFHGDTNEQKKDPKPSVVALCAATNVHFTKYTFAFRTQIGEKGAPVEIVQNMDEMVAEVMQEYLKHREMPSEIIFFRDGVGEKMYKKIATEITQLMHVMTTLSEVHNKPRPKLTFIVVPKRHHLRTHAPDGFKGNPPPGTLIDHPDVVDEGPDNFYLYSHKALAGTAKPTHYIVVENEGEYSVQQLAEFTYALAHLHQGCTKAVSLPAPVFYADRACGVVGDCFRDKVNTLDQNLKHTLFMI